MTQPTVSHHLRVLREAGWVRSERSASFVYYYLLPEAVARFGPSSPANSQPSGRRAVDARTVASAAGRPALVSHPAAVRVLFLCTHNSARSQMAEGFLRALGGGRYEVASAGTEATHVRPEAITAMAELGIDISGQTSKTLESYRDDGVGPRRHRLRPGEGGVSRSSPGLDGPAHWGFDDPGGGGGLAASSVWPSSGASATRSRPGSERLLTAEAARSGDRPA